MTQKIFNLSNLTLLVALLLSSIAAWYSIVGLTAIFAGAVVPIVVMGGVLEVAKITTIVWLRKYWHQCGILLKLYLVPAVVMLALLTSMGIFGFLSKSHLEHGAPTGDVAAKISLLDEKIKTQRENINAARTALQQLDSQVNNVMNKGDSERSAERSVQIRRQQAGERTKLQKEIEVANSEIAKLNEERAPIATQLRKVEAEIGPLKYVAALIYGDNPDQNTLERAVRWVIIILVLVFDPLAIALVLAGNASKNWKPDEEIETSKTEGDLPPFEIPSYEKTRVDMSNLPTSVTSVTTSWSEPLPQVEDSQLPEIPQVNEFKLEDHPYLFNVPKNRHPPGIEPVGPQVYHREPVVEVAHEPSDPSVNCIRCGLELVEIDHFGKICPDSQCGVRQEPVVPSEPEVDLSSLEIVADNVKIDSNFGATFPKPAKRGNIFVKVDTIPHTVFKYDGKRWIEINKLTSDSYLSNEYLRYLIAKIDSGEYDVELLTASEKDYIRDYLKSIAK